MKNIKNLSFVLFALAALTGCPDDEHPPCDEVCPTEPLMCDARTNPLQCTCKPDGLDEIVVCRA